MEKKASDSELIIDRYVYFLDLQKVDKCFRACYCYCY
jgi:hypothetical protein